jgi:hypothetical protein
LISIISSINNLKLALDSNPQAFKELSTDKDFRRLMENSQKLEERIKSIQVKDTSVMEDLRDIQKLAYEGFSKMQKLAYTSIKAAVSSDPISQAEFHNKVSSLSENMKQEARRAKESRELVNDYKDISSKISSKNTNNQHQNKVVENKAFKENLDKVARNGFSEATIATAIAESSRQTKQNVNLVRNSNSLTTKQEEQQHQYKLAQGM